MACGYVRCVYDLICFPGSVADSARVTMEKKEKDAQETSPQHDSTAASTSLSQQRAPESSQSHPAPTPSPHLPIETLTGSSGLTDSPSSNGCASEGGTEAGPSAAGAALAGETQRDGRPAEDFPEAPAVTDVVSHSPSREGPGEERQDTLLPPQAHTPPGQHMEPTHTAHTPDGLLSHTTAGTHTQYRSSWVRKDLDLLVTPSLDLYTEHMTYIPVPTTPTHTQSKSRQTLREPIQLAQKLCL